MILKIVLKHIKEECIEEEYMNYIASEYNDLKIDIEEDQTLTNADDTENREIGPRKIPCMHAKHPK